MTIDLSFQIKIEAQRENNCRGDRRERANAL